MACFAQKPYKVVFYNFENLFDTIHDPGVLDEEFTPEGPKRWNSAKYTRKIGNLERVLFDIAAEDKDYPVVIGVSEIENRSVMEDVIAQPKLAPVPTFSSWREVPPFRSRCRNCPTSGRVISSRCGARSTASRSSSS